MWKTGRVDVVVVQQRRSERGRTCDEDSQVNLSVGDTISRWAGLQDFGHEVTWALSGQLGYVENEWLRSKKSLGKSINLLARIPDMMV